VVYFVVNNNKRGQSPSQTERRRNMARAGFGNPKVKKQADVYVCPKCGGDLSSIKRNGAMYLTCQKSPKLLASNPENVFHTGAFEKGHQNFSASCDIGDVLVVNGSRHFEVKKD